MSENFQDLDNKMNPPPAYYPPVVGPEPICITCPYCKSYITTIVTAKTVPKTHLMAMLLCCIGCQLCCCIPYCKKSCKNCNHYCPGCQNYLGTYRA